MWFFQTRVLCFQFPGEVWRKVKCHLTDVNLGDVSRGLTRDVERYCMHAILYHREIAIGLGAHQTNKEE